jgi:hypothetical protein
MQCLIVIAFAPGDVRHLVAAQTHGVQLRIPWHRVNADGVAEVFYPAQDTVSHADARRVAPHSGHLSGVARRSKPQGPITSVAVH